MQVIVLLKYHDTVGANISALPKCIESSSCIFIAFLTGKFSVVLRFPGEVLTFFVDKRIFQWCLFF